MIKRLLPLLLLLAALTPTLAQQPELRFGASRKFKIVQLTDLHIKWQDHRSDSAFACIRNVVEAEKPDLIMLTGDIIYSSPATDNMRSVLQFVSSFKIPFALTFGNHDHEQGANNAELLQVVQGIPYCIVSTQRGISGEGNCALSVKSADGVRDAAALYCFDSQAYTQLKPQGVDGYDHIRLDQLQWYINTSKRYARRNDHKPLPSLAFFHIPLPEFAEAAASQNTTLYGIHNEKVCAPALNSGLFAAMMEQGDVMGIFVGHDHDNDFAVNWYSILLAYGRFSGGNTVYNHLSNGARVIELTEDKRTIHTWIRLRDGKVEQETVFPTDYTKK
ncbi:metallophosphoesterase family protein [uncultured Acetobacteroides sp.]|uniref:metallophosphoesterase family protein n=1 Tax=uncultured Acetobacteroides sp. TaxID=1760811 RepID=UPI0029F5808A|nr:metallophosphoesterase family protein [uncultured Acetobacteroides sp.]